MYQPAEARPGPSQASKVNLFVRIINVFKITLLTIFVIKITLLTIFVKVPSWMFEELRLHL